MSYTNHEMRYLELSRRQLRRQLDEMGYGQRAQTVTASEDRPDEAAGMLLAFAAIVTLLVSLSLSRLVS
jgi:hypothetical protein